jgi:hypothetical protein
LSLLVDRRETSLRRSRRGVPLFWKDIVFVLDDELNIPAKVVVESVELRR